MTGIHGILCVTDRKVLFSRLQIPFAAGDGTGIKDQPSLNESAYVNSQTDRFAPLDFLERSEAFFDAFRKLPKDANCPISWPHYFLFCHAVELALKAYLLQSGLMLSQLRKKDFGHNLNKLMQEAVKHNLSVGLLAQNLAMLSEPHENFLARYPQHNGKPILLVDQFEPLLIELLEAVSTVLRGGAKRRLWVQYG